jgi:heme-degrading monooxygenase HmoA
MSTVVINHLHFGVPVAELRPEIEEHFPPVFRECRGFQHFYLVQTGEDRATVVIVWDTAEDAEAGAAAIGPTLFARYVAPRLASEQQRVMGTAIVEC